MELDGGVIESSRLYDLLLLGRRPGDANASVVEMERLYDLLHRVSKATHRKGVLGSDLSFLTGNASV
jgi:hypothetical protein